MNLIHELQNLTGSLQKANVEFALCGGLAMAVYAFPRATLDIDLLIRESDLEPAKEAAKAAGFTLDSGMMSFRQGRSKIYRMTKIVPGDRDPLMLDILLTTSELEEVWQTRRVIQWEHGDIPVVSPRGLIRLKELRGSGQDKEDIEKLRSLEDES